MTYDISHLGGKRFGFAELVKFFLGRGIGGTAHYIAGNAGIGA